MAQTERNDWHKSTEIGGIVYSETVALLRRRMQTDSSVSLRHRISKRILDTFNPILIEWRREMK